MKIAVFKTKDGNVFPLYERGFVELYSEEKNKWHRIKEIPFNLDNNMNMLEVQTSVFRMVDQLEDCKMMVIDKIKHYLLVLIEEKGIGIWKHEGEITGELLSHIKSQFEKNENETVPVDIQPTAVGNEKNGIYKFDLDKVLDSDSSLDSLNLLLPFLENTEFRSLEIISESVPKWFNKKFNELNLEYTMAKSNDDLKYIVVTPKVELLAAIKEHGLAKHPCFDEDAKHMHARVHLPVAPKCNIQCNYCNRKYDCVNESRPGVTSSVLTPKQAVEYLKILDKKMDKLSVVGIAGPGDPFANPKETLETMRLIKQEFPEKIFCLSTNGLGLYPYIDRIAELGVSHVTITINAIDTEIGAKMYRWMSFNKQVYRGIEGAKVLLENQLKCIPKLKEKGIVVKINSIIVPGINEHHIAEVARRCAELGADVMNCIPLIPTDETDFADIVKPDKKMISQVRLEAGEYMKMMNHCARCRADAAGLLGQDMTETYTLLQEIASHTEVETCHRPYVAVASINGMMVNQHLGEAKEFSIYMKTPNGFQFVEKRPTPPEGLGDKRWLEMAKSLSDCLGILVSGAGDNPKAILKSCGLRVVEMMGLIDEGLEGIFNNKAIQSIAKAGSFSCGNSCGGSKQGCVS